jgi:hypothetical protein
VDIGVIVMTVTTPRKSTTTYVIDESWVSLVDTVKNTKTSPPYLGREQFGVSES